MQSEDHHDKQLVHANETLQRVFKNAAHPALMEMEGVFQAHFQVENPTVILQDTEATMRDFAAAGKGEAADFILNNSGFVSGEQIKQNSVNEDIPCNGVERAGFRPNRYGRAAIFVAGDTQDRRQSFLDIKGTGVGADRTPQNLHHQDGMLALPEAFSELIMIRVLNTLFDRLDENISCLGIYALIDLGFDINSAFFNAPMPAAQLVRRAHLRDELNQAASYFGSDRFVSSIVVELFLRQFGLTTSSWSTQLVIRRRDQKLDLTYAEEYLGTISESELQHMKGIKKDGWSEISVFAANVQQCERASASDEGVVLVDFGHYRCDMAQNDPLLFLAYDQPGNWGLCLSPDEELSRFRPAEGAKVPDLFALETLPAEIADWAGVDRQKLMPAHRAFSLYLTFKRAQGEFDEDTVDRQIATFVEDTVETMIANCKDRDILKTQDIRSLALAYLDERTSAS